MVTLYGNWRAGDGGSDDDLPGNWSVYSSRPVTLARVAWLERECPGWERHDFDVRNHSNPPKATR